MKLKFLLTSLVLIMFLACTDEPDEEMDFTEENEGGQVEEEDSAVFYFGADLSYINQILDHGGVYKSDGVVTDPYQIFSNQGTNVVRLRLWHNPQWTKTVYEPIGDQLYNDLLDVERAAKASKDQGMKVLLDLHYSDTWADPGHQEIPDAWKGITDIEILADSVYDYTFKVLNYLNSKDLMPEFVQIGNETNCGMLYEGASSPDFPTCNGCNGEWSALRTVINSAIQAVRDASASSTIQTKVILHVADPVNVKWWFDNVTAGDVVSDFDIIGFSYYPIWHTGVSISDLSKQVINFKQWYNKEVMILETAYPWTLESNDTYNNLFGDQTPITGYPFTLEGHSKMLQDITDALRAGGGIGVFYWEPAWITSDMKDKWGTGSSWENCTLFDFEGNANQGFDYMNPIN